VLVGLVGPLHVRRDELEAICRAVVAAGGERK
jgi:hypothetical protein